VGSLVLLHIFSWFWQWNNFENRLIFDEFKAYQKTVPFLGHPVRIRPFTTIWAHSPRHGALLPQWGPLPVGGSRVVCAGSGDVTDCLQLFCPRAWLTVYRPFEIALVTRFILLWLLTVFYREMYQIYPVPDLAKILNGTGYRNRIFYLFIFLQKKTLSITALESECHKLWLAANHLQALTACNIHTSMHYNVQQHKANGCNFMYIITIMRSNGTVITISGSVFGSGRIRRQISGHMWFRPSLRNFIPSLIDFCIVIGPTHSNQFWTDLTSD